ncbi:MAG: PEGA domain-containing protein [Kofleriaceae bacterium]
MGDSDFDVRIKTAYEDPAALMSALGGAMAQGSFCVPARLPEWRPFSLEITTCHGVTAMKGTAEVVRFEDESTWVRFLSAGDFGPREGTLVLSDVEVQVSAALARTLPSRRATATHTAVADPRASGDRAFAPSGARTTAARVAIPVAPSPDERPPAPPHPSGARQPAARAAIADPRLSGDERPPAPPHPSGARTTAARVAIADPRLSGDERPVDPPRAQSAPPRAMPPALPPRRAPTHMPRSSAPPRVVAVPPKARGTGSNRTITEDAPGAAHDPDMQLEARASHRELFSPPHLQLPSDAPDEGIPVVLDDTPDPTAPFAARPARPDAPVLVDHEHPTAPRAPLAPRAPSPASLDAVDAVDAPALVDPEPPPAPRAPSPARVDAPSPASVDALVDPGALVAPALVAPALVAPALVDHEHPTAPRAPLASPADPRPAPQDAPGAPWWTRPAPTANVPDDEPLPAPRRREAPPPDAQVSPYPRAQDLPDTPLVIAPPAPRSSEDPTAPARATTLPPSPRRRRLRGVPVLAAGGVCLALAALWWALPSRGPQRAGSSDPRSADLDAVPPATLATAAASATPAVPAAAPLAPTAEAAETAETSSPAGTSCRLSVASNVDGATLYLGGEVVGVTPQVVEAPCAPATLEVRHPRYRTAAVAVDPKPGVTDVDVRLTRPIFTIKIVSSPPGAGVLVNGRSIGITPVVTSVLAFEKGSIVWNQEGGATKTMQIYPRVDGAVYSAALPVKRTAPRTRRPAPRKR